MVGRSRAACYQARVVFLAKKIHRQGRIRACDSCWGLKFTDVWCARLIVYEAVVRKLHHERLSVLPRLLKHSAPKRCVPVPEAGRLLCSISTGHDRDIVDNPVWHSSQFPECSGDLLMPRHVFLSKDFFASQFIAKIENKDGIQPDIVAHLLGDLDDPFGVAAGQSSSNIKAIEDNICLIDYILQLFNNHLLIGSKNVAKTWRIPERDGGLLTFIALVWGWDVGSVVGDFVRDSFCIVTFFR